MENFAVPHVPSGRKRKRRSSILKTVKPLDELQNIQSGGDRLHPKERRVSFANTIKIKEFLRELPAQFQLADCPPNQGHGSQCRTETLPEDHVIQVSTPKGQKKRCRVSVAGADRLSIIPKLEKSFTMLEDEDFEPWCDTDPSPKALTPPEKAPIAEQPVPSVQENVTFTLTGGAPQASAELQGTDPGNSSVIRDCSNMDISLNDSVATGTVLLSASAFLPKVVGSPKTTEEPVVQSAVATPSHTMEHNNSDMDITLGTASPSTNFPSNHNSVDMSFTVVQSMISEVPPGQDIPPPPPSPVADATPCITLPDPGDASNHNSIAMSFTEIQPQFSFSPPENNAENATNLESTNKDIRREELSNHNSVHMSFTMVQPTTEVVSPSKCSDFPTPKCDTKNAVPVITASEDVRTSANLTESVRKSGTQPASLPSPEKPVRVPVKFSLPSQKPSAPLRLVKPSPVVRQSQSSFTGHHSSLFHTPLGPLANIYDQLPGRGNPLPSTSRLLVTPRTSEKRSTIQPKITITPSASIPPKFPTSTEKSSLCVAPALLAAPVPPPLLPADATEDDSAEWLHDSKEASFALVDSSLDSSPSSTECRGSDEPVKQTFVTPSPWFHKSQPSDKYVSDLRSTIENLKVGSQDKCGKALMVESPDTVVLTSDAIATSPDAMTDANPNMTTMGNTTLMDGSILLQKSLMLSPSAFNRFLEALQCDKSVCTSTFFVPPDDSAADEPQKNDCETEQCTNRESHMLTNAVEKQPATAHLNETFTLSPGRCNTLGANATIMQQPSTDEDMNATQAGEVQPDARSADTADAVDTKKVDSYEEAYNAPLTFGAYLTELHNRMTGALRELDYMLSVDDHNGDAQKCVKLLHSAVLKAVTGVALLVSYGERSGLSATHNWDTTDLPLLSSLPCLPAMLGDCNKLNWLRDLHEVLQEMYLLLAVVLGEAACLYPWQLEEVTDSGLEITLQRGCRVKIQLAEVASGSPARPVSSVLLDPPSTIPQCNTILDLPEMLWNLTQTMAN